ncbi:MSC_0623 family F1-like ATPase-associated protein [Clostridium algidicarnis]|uniref:DUF2714 domain-containing protein n=1 Tax=Clostridium algidicarnis TaxID=37659 RepID=A0ABS6C6B3_9CLOT|nr:DUF2714 domain-containing protein [Clostridium algidicarnis]MBU3197364.1 DUF2714 domain-containing protein [Clostridium algidicarnis]MBU3207853.1 DUF2714 domain-containing protein [Clostridium algidicarnis]MBU3221018.1 DUF2714 domain-containing protein [Clostridium algidicarnis]
MKFFNKYYEYQRNYIKNKNDIAHNNFNIMWHRNKEYTFIRWLPSVTPLSS